MLTLMLSGSTKLTLEHSLVSLSKWEAFHEKPFYSKEGMSREESLSYVEMMAVGEIPEGYWLSAIDEEMQAEIQTYINSKQTGTWFREDPNARPSREVITNEIIYHWMIEFGIPFDPCQNWHLNHLMTLIKICGIKRTKPKRMSRSAQAEEMRRINAQRRAALGTAG